MINKLIKYISSFNKYYLNTKKKKLKFLLNIKEAKKIFQSLGAEKSNTIMFVGGCVRKALKNELIDDIDLATLYEPNLVIEKLKNHGLKFVETGISHGTITVVKDGKTFEITTLRKDILTDGRHAKVLFTKDWKEDAYRRDFTINAIYLNSRGEIYDPTNGIEDLENGIVKFIGDAEKRIQEDYLRILRYCRFFIQYSSITHDPSIIKEIKKNLNGINLISNERKLKELKKILTLKNFKNIQNFKEIITILTQIFPQLKYYTRIEKLKILTDDLSKKISTNLILAILIIDSSDNHDYFNYRYKISNKIKNKYNYIAKNFKDILNENFFTENMIKKHLYFNEKQNVEDLLIFSFFINDKISVDDLKNKLFFLNKISKPKFPISGKFLKENGFESGEKLGKMLKKMENQWISDNFVLDQETIDRLLKNKQ